ncbi:MAG: glycosyltransferase family 39 protein [Acidimicrobiia bacterium]|nr:glycosyltransferase family 39 protein [Acidimicrobiia bacterium]
MRRHWPLVLVLAAFVAAAFVIPTLAPVSVNDDFLYARSVQILVHDHHVRVLPAAAMTLVFQIGWGGLFAAVFGDSLGVLRAATVTFAGLGGLAMYALCRELKVTPARSALGVAVFLFNPIGLALSYTFMTDTYLLTLVTVAVWCFVRGLRGGEPDVRWTLAGSVATSLAFLVRQPGLLVAIGVLTWLLLARQLRWDRRSVGIVARVVALPVLTAVAYYLWAGPLHGVPARSGQSTSAHAVTDAGVGGSLALSRYLVVFLVVYLGLFVLPIVVGLVASVLGMVRAIDRPRRVALLGVIAAPIALSIGAFGLVEGHQPWAPQFFGRVGVGPVDIRGGRPFVLPLKVTGALLVVAMAAALVLVLALLQRRRPAESRLGLLLAVGAWLALAVVPQSMPLRDSTYSYDRYFLPLLPLAVAGLLGAVRPVRIIAPVAWTAVALMAGFSVAATHDHLALQRATWRLAASARADGIPARDLDAGAAWDGTHLYEHDFVHGVRVKVDLRELRKLGFTDHFALSPRDGPAWWLSYYARSDTSRYVVAGDRLYGYAVVRRIEYPSWLHRDPQHLYLLRAR